METILALVGAVFMLALLFVTEPIFMIRDRGRHDPDGSGPLPTISRVPAIVAYGVLAGGSTLGLVPHWSAPLLGLAAAGGLSMGHLGGAGLTFGPIAERYLSWYEGRKRLTYVGLAVSGVLTTAWAGAAAIVAGAWWAAPLAVLGGLGKVWAYHSSWKHHLARVGGDQALAWEDGMPMTAASRAGLCAAAGTAACLVAAAAARFF